MPESRRILRRSGRVLGWGMLLATSAVLAVTVAVPRLAGATTYTVLTASMEPSLPPGTMLVVRPTEARDVEVGSVLTYQLRSGEPEVVTHRVVAVDATRAGGPLLQTRGDANGAPDQDWVHPPQVRGTLWYAVPWVGRLALAWSPQERRLAARGAAALLGAYGVLVLASGVRERRRTRPEVGRG